jgi:hypothetical protein
VILSFVYKVACGAFQLALRLWSSERKEVEILVLSHELAIGRRQLGTPRPSATDHAACRPKQGPAAIRVVGVRGQPEDPAALASPAGEPALDL